MGIDSYTIMFSANMVKMSMIYKSGLASNLIDFSNILICMVLRKCFK